MIRSALDGLALLLPSRPTYDSLDISADGSIRLKGFAVSADDRTLVTAEAVTFSAIREQLGRFEIGDLKVLGVTLQLPDGMSLIIPQLTLRAAEVRQVPAGASDEAKARAAVLPAKEYRMPEALVLLDDQSAAIEDVAWAWEGEGPTGTGVAQFRIGRIAVSGSMLKRRVGVDPLALLGYGSVDLSLTGRWTIAPAGDDNSHEVVAAIAGKDMGTLSANAAAERVSATLLHRLLLGRVGENDLLADFGRARFKHLSVRYEDKSLATRWLNAIAGERQRDIPSLIAEATGEVRRAAEPLKDAAFADQAIDAVTTFMGDPRSFEVRLSPPTPVPGTVLMDAASVPSVLLYVLNPGLGANK